MKKRWFMFLLTAIIAVGLAFVIGCGDDDDDDGGDNGNNGGDIAITVGSGTEPDISWDGGPVYSLSVTTVAEPEVIIWGCAGPGTDSVESPVTYGTVPAGAVPTFIGDPTLVEGTEYRVSLVRMDQTMGYTTFTP